MDKEAAEFTVDKLEQYFNAAKQVIEMYGGDVAQLGLNALRIEAGSGLAIGIILLILGTPVYKLFKKIGDYEAATSYNGKDRAATIVIGGLVGFIMVMVILGCLLNIWSWIGIFYPELYAVHKFLM